MKKISKVFLLASMSLSFASFNVSAGLVNGTGNVNPDVIFGSGNANGSFSGEVSNNIEVGLRGKLRYNNNGLPENTFNFDGDRTYIFDPTQSNAPSNRSAFNFEWSVNVDASGTGGNVLADYQYLIEIDYDPSQSTAFTSFNPINVLADNSYGTNSTTNGGGTKHTPSNVVGFINLVNSNNVAQNSWNLGFFASNGFDPQTEGLYTIQFSALDGSNNVLSSSSIDILYGTAPTNVPTPSMFALLALGLGVVGFSAKRKS